MTNRNKTIFSPLLCSATLALAGCSQQVSNMKRGFLLTTEQEPKQEEQFPSSSQSQEGAMQAKMTKQEPKQEEQLPSSSQSKEGAMQAKDPAVIFNYLKKQGDDMGGYNVSQVYHLFTEALKRAAGVAKNKTVAQAFHKAASAFHEAAIAQDSRSQHLYSLMQFSREDILTVQCKSEEFQKAAAVSSTVNNLDEAATKYMKFEEGQVMLKLVTQSTRVPQPDMPVQYDNKLKVALGHALAETEKAFNLAAGVTSDIKIQKHFKEVAAASSVASSKANKDWSSDSVFHLSLKEVVVAAAKAYEPTSK